MIEKDKNVSTLIFTARLRERRKLSNLTQTEVATKLGIPRSTYSGYEKGLREAGYGVLVNLSSLFDVSIDYLLGRTDKPKCEKEKNAYKFLQYNNIHWNGVPLLETDIKIVCDILENIINARTKK
jgi:transcriptional regulator with XRE-family HTH domain